MAVPISLWLHFAAANPLFVFIVACLGIVPAAGLISTSTEHLAERTGPMIGALLNAAFGNATELIVAIAALDAGLIRLVQASLAGSILGNLLLILGLSLVVGGRRESVVRFNPTAAGMGAAMLALAVAAMILPSLLPGPPSLVRTEHLSYVVAVILALTYLGSIAFTMGTYRRAFAAKPPPYEGTHWPVWLALLMLGIATVVVAVESEFLVDTIGSATQALGLSEGFIGLILIPIIGNAAEHATAVTAAHRGKYDLSLQIALGSSTQIALLVAPLLVLIGALMSRPMSLLFSPYEVATLGIAVIVSSLITLDGESHWFEGMQLLALYAMVAAGAWFI